VPEELENCLALLRKVAKQLPAKQGLKPLYKHNRHPKIIKRSQNGFQQNKD
jgi:hypothetical protein